MVGSMTGSMVGGMTGPLTLRKGGGSRAAGLLRDYAAGFAFSAIDMSAMVKGHTTNFNGNANDLLTYASPSTKYVRNSAGVLVPGTTLRLDHDENGVPLGLLIEEQRTNSLLNSKFAGAVSGSPGTAPTSWSFLASGGTTAVGTSRAPSGQKITLSSPNGARHMLGQNVAVAANTTYIFSFAVDVSDSASPVWQYIAAASLPAGATQEWLLDGAVVAGSSTIPLGYHILAYRLVVGSTAGTIGLRFGCGIQSNTVGLNTCTFDLAQFEVGAFRSSYIPTEASQVTRAADNITLATSLFPFNATEGAIVAEVRTGLETSGTPSVWHLDDGTANNRVFFFFNSAVQPRVNVVVGGAAQAGIITSTSTTNTIYRHAAAYKVDDFAASIDGGTAVTDTEGTLPTVTTLRVGHHHTTGARLNGHIRSLTYIPERLSNALLEELSA
jgi:hypothetical protein